MSTANDSISFSMKYAGNPVPIGRINRDKPGTDGTLSVTLYAWPVWLL